MEENQAEDHRGLVTRFNYDHVFSTRAQPLRLPGGHQASHHGLRRRKSGAERPDEPVRHREQFHQFAQSRRRARRAPRHPQLYPPPLDRGDRRGREKTPAGSPNNLFAESAAGIGIGSGRQIEVHPSLREAHRGKEEKFIP